MVTDRIGITIGQCLVPDENSACWIPIRLKTLSDGYVNACLSYDSVWYGIESFRRRSPWLRHWVQQSKIQKFMTIHTDPTEWTQHSRAGELMGVTVLSRSWNQCLNHTPTPSKGYVEQSVRRYRKIIRLYPTSQRTRCCRAKTQNTQS